MWFGEEDSGGFVARKLLGQETFAGSEGACADSLGKIRRGGGMSCTQDSCVERSDGENSDAALMATRAAGEVCARSPGGGGKRSVDDGKEFVHALRKVYRLPQGAGSFSAGGDAICIVARARSVP
jgi:hypothetical protein